MSVSLRDDCTNNAVRYLPAAALAPMLSDPNSARSVEHTRSRARTTCTGQLMMMMMAPDLLPLGDPRIIVIRRTCTDGVRRPNESRVTVMQAAWLVTVRSDRISVSEALLSSD